MRLWWNSLLLLAIIPSSLPAQQRTIEQIRDSLNDVTDVPALRRTASALARGPQARQSSVLMERGLVLLRVYQLTRENRAGDQARDCFERIIQRDPGNGWAHYGLGLALVGGPGVRVPSPGGILDGFVLGQSLAEIAHLDPQSRASRHFLKAIELDSTLTPAAVELAALGLATRNRRLLERSQETLQMMVSAGFTDEDLTTALARVQSALGDVAAAAATAEAAAPAHSAGATTLLARAEALLRQPGQTEAGARAYFEGIERTDAGALDVYFNDLRIIASAAELLDWSQGNLDGRRRWLSTFWDVRAASAGKTVAERLAEHYRRLAEAQERFRRTGRRGGAPIGSSRQLTYDPDQLPFDERGLIYVRHGEPERVIRTSNPELRPNESWIYTLPSGQQTTFHFVQLRDGTDFRLVDDILLAMDPSSQEFPYDGVIQMLEDRAPVDARYNLLAVRFNSIRNMRWAASAANVQCLLAGGTGCVSPGSAAGMMGDNVGSMFQTIAQTRQTLATENREATLNALASDSDRPVFAAPLPFYYDVFTFRGSDHNTDLTAAVAIPASSLTATQVDGAFVYSLQLSLMVIDTLAARVTRRDSVYQFRSARPLGSGEHLRVHADLAAAASHSTIHRLVVRDLSSPGRGQMYGGTTTVPAYDEAALMMSDIVLAEPEPGAWHRGNANLALVPPRQFMEGQPLTLFYELYNLPQGAAYRTEITLAPTEAPGAFGRIKRLFGGSGGSVQLQFDGAAEPNGAGHVQEVRRVTTELKPGKYRVRIRATNLTNQQIVVAEKEFVVLKQDTP